MDPDRGTVVEAAREAAGRGAAGKARWVQARAEDLPAGPGTFDVATFARSFRWMDRDLVAVTIKRILKTGGVLAHISDLKTETDSETGPGKGRVRRRESSGVFLIRRRPVRPSTSW
ncbi:class I SAM-dependent methyltransferase [Streptomyces sp. NPDC057681]|uniref:class I SAM-dependent methyltransferase n=1 Tax=Streptomyces sp. NPDC057681 TaxID=3346209 RepID=UPI0036B53DAA